VTAANGRQAVEVATRELPDAILLDVMMADMDGPTTTHRIPTRPNEEPRAPGRGAR